MMGQPSRWMALLARIRQLLPPRQLAATAAVIAAGLVLGGCSTRWRLPTTLYVTVGVSNDQSIDSELVDDIQVKLSQLRKGFKELYPHTNFQVSLYPEAEVAEAIRLRSSQGLGPDLVLVNGDTAMQLLQEGLTDPFPATAAELTTLNPDALRRIRLSGNSLVGLPLLLQTQLSCFNRQKLPRVPATVDDLLNLAADGIPVGRPATVQNLFWSAGSLGALEGINEAIQGQQPSAAGQAGIRRWLGWLQNASYQQRVIFYANQPQAEADLVSGQLDWIPCRSTVLPRLRRKMGARLGVAALPNGDSSMASPINRLRVIGLGKNSSQAGRDRALAFSRFSLNPLTQRTVTVGEATYLPANRFVRVPVASSAVLAAMQTASQQGQMTNTLISNIHHQDRRIVRIQSLINELVFGEVSPDSATTQAIRILRERR